MTQTQQHCSTPDQLLTFLRGQLSAQEESELQLHLNDCVSCRERLENAAADSNSWNEAKQFFGSGALHASSDDSTSGHEEATQGSQRIRQVLDSLGPSDDPESLGRIGGYEVTGVVGSGGMGVVLKAQDRSLDRIVAIKVMSPHLASSGSARKRFAREAKAAAAVLHPNVIAIHGVASDDACPYLVMPYVRGSSLQKRIDSQGPLPLKDALRIGAQIAAGLAAAHEQGLVHRDIKPANILLEGGVERVTITDFGLARAVDDASMTCSGVIAGTPQYMSPEQARGEPIDARSDLFSLGSVLYAMCAGRSPFRAETTYGVLHRIANDCPTPVCEVNSDVPVWLGHIIERLMAKRVDDRFESAKQVAELLEGCLAHAQQPAAMPLPVGVQALAAEAQPRISSSPESKAKDRRKAIHQQIPPIGKFIAAAAFACAIVFAGVLIVLELDKGTLTIESEVDDVPIRIVQGENVVKQLTVSKHGATTRLRAGKYAIEVDADSAAYEILGDHVTLKRGELTIATVSLTNPQLHYVEMERVLATETTGENKFGLIKSDAGWRINDLWYGLKPRAESAMTVPRLDASEVANEANGVENSISDKTMKSLQGVWEFISVESDGVVTEYKTLTTQPLAAQLTVKGDMWMVNAGAGSGGHRVKIDGNKLTFYGMTTSMPSIGSSIEVATIGYGLFKLDGDSLVYIMTPAVAGGDFTGQSEPPIKFPESFETKGTQSNVFRLRRVGVNESTVLDPNSRNKSSSAKASPEFPPVTILVQDEEGKPLEGIQVSLFQAATKEGGKVVEISETSDARGVAVNRNLPYGHYEISARTTDGWYLPGQGSKINVEFEKGFVVTLVAPTPNRTAKLAIGSDVGWRSANISELRFGELKVGNGSGYTVYFAPEPEVNGTGKEPIPLDNVAPSGSASYESFPTIINGIEHIGAEIRIEIERIIPQPALSTSHINTHWKWYPRDKEKSFGCYLIADGHSRGLVNGSAAEDKSLDRRPIEGSEFFKLPGPSHRVGASLLSLRESSALPLEIEIPAGAVKVFIDRFFGKPNAKVMAALDWRPQENQPELWLNANIQRNSAWITRMVDTNGWTYSVPGDGGSTLSGHLLRREHSMRSGETLEVAINAYTVKATVMKSFDARSIDDVTSVYNERTRQLRLELFNPPIPDLTTEQMQAAMLAAAELYRKHGTVEIASALKTSAETNRLADRLTFMGMSGTMSEGFRQITPQFNFEVASNALHMVVLSKAELRYSLNGWSSKTWGDIHPPITGKWDLIAVEERGEPLTDNSFNEWRLKHADWTRLAIDENSLTLGGDNATKSDFEIDYDAGPLPQYMISQDGDTKYVGVLMGNGFVDDTTLVFAVDLTGSSKPKTFHTKDGKTTNLTFRRKGAAAQTPQSLSPNASSTSSPAPGIAATADEAYQALDKLLSNPKMDWKTTEDSIATVATRMTSEIEFTKYVLARFEKACAGGKSTFQARRHLLAALTRAFHAWGQSRWNTDTAPIQQHTSNRPIETLPTLPQAIRDFESKALEFVVSYGRKATRSDIVDFARAARAIHHPDAQPFLRDILLSAPAPNASPYAQSANIPPTSDQNIWSDNLGGTWPDARFVAAVGLAELGDQSAIDWLLAKAQPNDFGLDESVNLSPHMRDRSGSLRESSRCALIDLFGQPADSTGAELSDWWKRNRAQLISREVRLKLDQVEQKTGPNSSDQPAK